MVDKEEDCGTEDLEPLKALILEVLKEADRPLTQAEIIERAQALAKSRQH